MSITTKKSKESYLFLSKNDVFSSVTNDLKSIDYPVISKSTGAIGEFYKTFLLERVSNRHSYIDRLGEIKHIYETYYLYVADYDISTLTNHEITQVFELCHSLKNGNYFGIESRKYVSTN